VSDSGTNLLYAANSLNQYSAVDDFTPQFDDDGNQTLMQTSTGVWQVQYNGENRPILWSNDNEVFMMSYDRMGGRVTKNDQRFVYDGYLQIADNQGDLYIWDPTEKVATRPLVWIGDASVMYYTHDGNKNVSEVVAAEDKVEAHYEYAPFGAVIVLHGASAMLNPWRFSSEYADIESSTVYYNYRHYAAIDGLWLSRKPAYEIFLSRGGVRFLDLLCHIGTEGFESLSGIERCHYVYLSNSPLVNYDIIGLAGGGPWHPPEGVKFACKWTDPCASLFGKMTLLAKMIHSHVGWDCLAPEGRGGGRHATEIADLYRAFANCGDIWYRKGCPGIPPLLDPYPKKQCKQISICQNGECKRIAYAAGLTATTCIVAYGVYKVARTCAAGVLGGPVGLCLSAALP
jgi:hypothetical protein